MEKNNSLVLIEEKSVFGRIKKFFRIMFGKNKIDITAEAVKQEEPISTNTFSQDLKLETTLEEANKKDKLEDIISIVEKEPQTLDKLSIEKLKVIDEYYDKKIEEVDKKITKLKSKLA